MTLPVAERLQATYAVAFTGPPADLRGTVRREVVAQFRSPLRELVLGMLDSPMLTLDLRPAGDFPPLPAGLLAAYGAAPADLAAVAEAGHLLAVRAAYRPGWPPAHEWAARGVAGAVAAAASAPVVDVFTPRILSGPDLRRSLPGPRGDMRLTDWMLISHSAGPDTVWFTTRGLARFGLPELRTENVPADLVVPWGRLLNGLARRLLDVYLEELANSESPIELQIPATLSVSLQDVAAASGETEILRREIAVRLHPAAPGPGDEVPVLTVHPADDGPDRPETLCTALFGETRQRFG
ncbi:hypothetical protein [Actinomadura rayongensis]|uniref:Uncharacterized protein n=1 Tax=Actinomadura rayongensis TaxID=1429076 RepID=A0A6I4WC70_9ACTN|nr:hypothetical protein [Actinomadura rayongensis]MXQ64342.1 hypothetical protein [Actinomadura rayongensis]